jgi:glycosyltransferase involved in cell wall biosynthesis
MTRDIHYFSSRDYARRTGGFVYNSRLTEALARQGGRILPIGIETAFPTIGQEALAALAPNLSAIGGNGLLLTDHIHVCQLLPLLRHAAFPVVSVFHHSLIVEHGNPHDEEGLRLSRMEGEALAASQGIIATSQESRRYLEEHYSIDAKRIRVAVPGNERASRSVVGATRPLQILSIGAVIPRKRYDYILEAASRLRATDWRWRIAGDPNRYPELVAQLRRSIADLGLGGRVELLGEVSDSDLASLWQTTSLFVAASRYEGYGMAVAEALSRGVPVVTTDSGAVATWASGGVIGAPADDAPATAALIDALLADPERLATEAERAWRFGQSLRTWEETFEGMGEWIGGLQSTVAGAPR